MFGEKTGSQNRLNDVTFTSVTGLVESLQMLGERAGLYQLKDNDAYIFEGGARFGVVGDDSPQTLPSDDVTSAELQGFAASRGQTLAV